MMRPAIAVALSVLLHAFSASAEPDKVPVYTKCSADNTFALTFDDGVSAEFGPTIMKTLSESQANVSWFINGNNYGCIYDQADILKARFDAGQHIANHGWSHGHMNQENADEMRRELQLVEDAMIKILGVKPKWFRPPYGEYGDLLLEILAERGYSGLIHWSEDSGDSATPPPPSSDIIAQYQNYPAQTIVLNHETRTWTANEVMPVVVPQLKSKYSLVSVPECLGLADPSQWYEWVGAPGSRDESWTCSDKPSIVQS